MAALRWGTASALKVNAVGLEVVLPICLTEVLLGLAGRRLDCVLSWTGDAGRSVPDGSL